MAGTTPRSFRADPQCDRPKPTLCRANVVEPAVIATPKSPFRNKTVLKRSSSMAAMAFQVNRSFRHDHGIKRGPHVVVKATNNSLTNSMRAASNNTKLTHGFTIVTKRRHRTGDLSAKTGLNHRRIIQTGDHCPNSTLFPFSQAPFDTPSRQCQGPASEILRLNLTVIPRVSVLQR